MTDLSDLIERVRKAEGPDRSIDHHCEAAFRTFKGMTDWGVHDGPESWLKGSEKRDFGVPKYTASFDTMMSAVEILLPTAWVDLAMSNRVSRAKVCFEGNRAYWSDESPSPQLAILQSLLLALQEPTHG